MRRSKREAARERAESLRQHYAQQKCARVQREEDLQKSLGATLQIPRGPEALVEAALSGRSQALLSKVHLLGNRPLAPRFDQLLRVTAKKVPRILTPDYVAALSWISTYPWVRNLEDWKPKGKGRDTIFRSLASHLVASYPMPQLIWGALFEDASRELAPVVGHLAAGGSLFKAVQDGMLTVPLTRKQCHELLQSPGDKFMEAIRRVQLQAFDGDRALLAAWMSTEAGRRPHSRVSEEFWITVIRWFCQNPMLDRQQVGPLFDFINYRRGADPTFSMKGRSALALMQGMEVWHGDLAKARSITGMTFKPAGYNGGTYTVESYKPGESTKTWRVSEVLNSKTLAAEGRALNHCVYSYAWNIERGGTSIWSLTVNDERAVTIEVRNDLRRIVQVRGKHNRAMTNDEYRIVLKWAQENNLEISSTRL